MFSFFWNTWFLGLHTSLSPVDESYLGQVQRGMDQYWNQVQNSHYCIPCFTCITCVACLTCLTGLTCLTCLTCLTNSSLF
jgi:hypothetical protein